MNNAALADLSLRKGFACRDDGPRHSPSPAVPRKAEYILAQAPAGPQTVAGRRARDTLPIFRRRFMVGLDDEVGYEIAIHRFEWRELKMIIEACARLKPDVFIDVGANLGLYTCVLGHLGVVPRLIAFEPDRDNFARLKANLALNNLTARVETHEAAVGARFGMATLVPSAPANRGMSRIGSGEGAYDVRVMALDEVVPHIGTQHRDQDRCRRIRGRSAFRSFPASWPQWRICANRGTWRGRGLSPRRPHGWLRLAFSRSLWPRRTI